MEKKKWIIAITIAVLLALFIGYGIEVFHDAPDNEDYCGKQLYEINDEQTCIDAGGSWLKEEERTKDVGPVVVNGFCREPVGCYEKFSLEMAKHDKVVFIACIIIGLLALIGGVLLKVESISVGILAGGVLTILYGTIRYWQHADKEVKFVLLGIALAAVIYLTYRKLEKR